VLFGNLWENSGSKESSRNSFLIFLCKLSAVVWQLAAALTLVALIVNGIRAIV